MTIGVAMLLIALVDELFSTLRTGRPSYRANEDVVMGTREG
jgi:hypothetical protein